jgi:Cu-processing system permease protein
MTSITPSVLSVKTRDPVGLLGNVLTVAGRELRDAVRGRWFLLYTLAFAVLGLAVSFVSASGTGGAGLSGFGRTTAGLINLVVLVVPLMALSSGAASIASDRERGMLSYILAQPVSRFEVLLGKYLGLAGALLACLCLGLGACATILAFKGVQTNPSSILWMAGLSFVLALGMLSVGILISTLARKALRLRIEELLALSLTNPLQVYKMWSLHAAEASLDVLGPAGLYATEEYGSRLHLIFGACMAAWIIAPLAAAGVVLSRRSPL